MSTASPIYPPKQPFPSRTAIRIGQEQDHNVFESAGKLVTYPTASFDPASRALQSYLREYSGDGVSDGMTLGVYGPYGSGKTHLLRWLHQNAAILLGEFGRSSRSILQVYAKVDTNDFLDLYRTILRQVDRSALQDINAKLLSKLAQKEVAKSPTTHGLVAKLQEQPRQVFELLRNTLISDSDVQKPQMQWVRKITGMEDFLHFTAWLGDPTLGDSAAAWLYGEELSENTLSRMGIKAPIDTPSRALAGLSFLISIFAEARTPLLIYIDQVERLLPVGQSRLNGNNAALIQSLAEWAQEKQAFLCVAGATKGSTSTPDLPGRFSVMVGMRSLDSESAANLLKAYLYDSGPAFQPYNSELDIYPYTFAAVDDMVRLVSGSVRGVLRLAFQSYEIASQNGDQIGPDIVQQAFRQFDDYFDKRAILSKIKELLADAGFTFIEEASLAGGPSADIAVFDARESVAFIEVADAVFDDDEARKALDFTKLAQSIRGTTPDAKLILIVAGYISPQVQSRLSDSGPGRTVDHYFIYAPDRFEDEFRLVLKSLTQERQRRLASASPGVGRTDLTGSINDLKNYFEKILNERLGNAENRQQRIANASEIQSATEKARSIGEIEAQKRALRGAEQLRLEKVRQSRDERDNLERNRVRDQGEEERKRHAIERTCWFTAAVVIATIAVVFLSWRLWLASEWEYPARGTYPDTEAYITARQKANEVPFSLYWLPILMGVVGSGLCYALSMRIIGPGPYSRLVRATRSAVPTLSDLDDLTIRLGRGPDFQGLLKNRSYLKQSLKDPNPQVRYAAARIVELEKGSPQIDLHRRVRVENWIKAEIVLLRLLTRHKENDLDQWSPSRNELTEFLREHLSYATAPEALYTLDALSRSTFPPTLTANDLKRYPLHVLLHAMFCGLVDLERIRESKAGSGRERFILEFALGYIQQSSTEAGYSPARQLSRLLRERGPDAEYSGHNLVSFDLQLLSSQRIEEAMVLFGPGGAESLGDHEDLGNASLYRQIYDSLFQVRIALLDLG